jgi:hypothetical protein
MNGASQMKAIRCLFAILMLISTSCSSDYKDSSGEKVYLYSHSSTSLALFLRADNTYAFVATERSHEPRRYFGHRGAYTLEPGIANLIPKESTCASDKTFTPKIGGIDDRVFIWQPDHATTVTLKRVRDFDDDRSGIGSSFQTGCYDDGVWEPRGWITKEVFEAPEG